ncbi:hypothetical protein OG369_39435 [Streptomyces sp. NBC_01221]|nr:hypothetical protein [Streptomyces sp. NBC_01221]MCX4791932.1 hypothetical protein [Streptomyces sp. NBC_01221]
MAFLLTWLMRLVIMPIIIVLTLAGVLYLIDLMVFGGQISVGFLHLWIMD